MKKPIHAYLDGERERDGLAQGEREELAALEAVVDAVAGPLRSAAAPDLSGRVLARIAGTRPAPSIGVRVAAWLRGSLGWLWTPRPVTIRLRPAYAFGTAAMFALLAVITPTYSPVAPAADQVAAGETAPVHGVYVQFRLEANGVTSVALAGSFNGWQPVHELRETAPGVWSILLPLEPGVHDYAFVLDGEEWIADPHALQVEDGFGGANSRIALAPLNG